MHIITAFNLRAKEMLNFLDPRYKGLLVFAPAMDAMVDEVRRLNLGLGFAQLHLGFVWHLESTH